LLLTDKIRISNERDKQDKEFTQQQDKAVALNKEYTESEKKLKQLKPQFESLEHKKIETNDLELIVQIKQNMEEIEHYRLRSKNGEAKVKEVETILRHTAQTLQDTTQEIQTLKQQKLEAGTLMEIAAWFSENHKLQDALGQHRSKAQSDTQELQKIYDEPYTLGIDPNS